MLDENVHAWGAKAKWHGRAVEGEWKGGKRGFTRPRARYRCLDADTRSHSCVDSRLQSAVTRVRRRELDIHTARTWCAMMRLCVSWWMGSSGGCSV
jgi:hypothetical protein